MPGAEGPARLSAAADKRRAGAKTGRRNDGLNRRLSRHRSGLFLQREGRSTAPSARLDGLDDVESGPECRVYIQMRGIEQVRVGGRF